MLHLLFCKCSLIFYHLPYSLQKKATTQHFVAFYLLRIFGWNFLLFVYPEQKTLGLALSLCDQHVTYMQQKNPSGLWLTTTRIHIISASELTDDHDLLPECVIFHSVFRSAILIWGEGNQRN